MKSLRFFVKIFNFPAHKKSNQPKSKFEK